MVRRTHREQPDRAKSAAEPEHFGDHTTGRRRFLGYLLAGPTLVAAAPLGQSLLAPGSAHADDDKNGKDSKGSDGKGDVAIVSNPQVGDTYDLSDAITDAALPTSDLIKVVINKDGSASLDVPRAETGQGMTTAVAMLVAEELDLPLDKVHITLADARPELVFNQITGGSTAVSSQYRPVRVAAAIAKGALLKAASANLGYPVSKLTSEAGVITGPVGNSVPFSSLATDAANETVKKASATLKDDKDFNVIGKSHNRIDGHDIVTGRKKFAMDLDKKDGVKDALPTMMCRPPTINGTVKSVNNADEVRDMPGITDVVAIDHGVAVRGEAFGYCIDAIRELDVDWGSGPVDNESDDTVRKELKDKTLPMVVPVVPNSEAVTGEFTFAFASNSPLEPGTAVADVRDDKAEIWSGMKVPITAVEQIAEVLGLPVGSVTAHVTQSGGCFGRRLFHDAAREACVISQKLGKPVRLMWHRTDDFRQGRAHPMSFSRIQASYDGRSVQSYEQHHTSVRSSFSHGFGEIITTTASRAPVGGLAVSEAIFELTTISSYNFGPTKQLLMETHQSPKENQFRGGFNTGAMRNVYSPNVCCAQELFVDMLAKKAGEDRVEFRRQFVKDDDFRKVLDKAAEEGNWGRKLPKHVGQGIGLHREYKNTTACFVELDCRPETVNRKTPDFGGEASFTGPRVLRAIFVTIPGSGLVNPRGMEAQLQGGFMDGVAVTLTSSLHLKDGAFLEGSWDNYFYTRQWNTPKDLEIFMLPGDPSEQVPGGGEVAVSATMAAVASAYGAAVGKIPTYFPVNHNRKDLGFEVHPTKPPVPQSPTDGLDHTFGA